MMKKILQLFAWIKEIDWNKSWGCLNEKQIPLFSHSPCKVFLSYFFKKIFLFEHFCEKNGCHKLFRSEKVTEEGGKDYCCDVQGTGCPNEQDSRSGGAHQIAC